MNKPQPIFLQEFVKQKLSDKFPMVDTAIFFNDHRPKSDKRARKFAKALIKCVNYAAKFKHLN